MAALADAVQGRCAEFVKFVCALLAPGSECHPRLRACRQAPATSPYCSDML